MGFPEDKLLNGDELPVQDVTSDAIVYKVERPIDIDASNVQANGIKFWNEGNNVLPDKSVTAFFNKTDIFYLTDDRVVEIVSMGTSQ